MEESSVDCLLCLKKLNSSGYPHHQSLKKNPSSVFNSIKLRERERESGFPMRKPYIHMHVHIMV